MGAPVKNPAKNFFKINLLIHRGEQLKIHIKLFRWLLSSGRFIVIFVEIIVITAFIARYKFDADIADFQERIKEQVPYLESLQEDEYLLRQTHFQLSQVKQIKNQNPNFAEVLLKIGQLTPKNTKLSNVTFDKTEPIEIPSISINGQAATNNELSSFLKALQNDPYFTNISLSNISFEGQTTFTIIGKLNIKGGKKD